MKYNDAKRLAKISVSTKEKSTNNTVRGVVIGLVVLVPVVFFALSFYFGLNKSIEKMKSLASFNIISDHYINDNTGYISYESVQKIKKLSGVEEIISGEYIRFNANEPSSLLIKINKSDYPFSFNLDNQKKINTTIKINDLKNNSKLFTSAEMDDLIGLSGDSNPFKVGTGFYGDGKGQIIISELILDYLKIPSEYALLEKISVDYLAQVDGYIDNDTNPNNEFVRDGFVFYKGYINLLQDYEIVGVIKKELFTLPSRINESQIWVSSSSIIEDDEYLLPYSREIISNNELINVYTYQNIDIVNYSKTIVNNGFIFLPIGLGANYAYNVNLEVYPYRVVSSIVQCDNFAWAMGIEKSIIREYKNNNIIDYRPDKNTLYIQIRNISTIATYVLFALVGFSFIVLITTLLNLYNTINYSVESRRHYIGVMRAIGAKGQDIKYLYFIEIVIILSRTLIWIFTIGGAVSIIIKYIVDEGLQKFKDIIPYDLKLELKYFPIAFFTMVILEFFIAYLYSRIVCRKVASKPILEILKDEK